MKMYFLKCKTKNKFPFNILALAIMKVESTNYSHTAIAFREDGANQVVFDSNSEKCTSLRTRKDFEKQYEVIEQIPFNFEMSEVDFSNFVTANDGKDYSELQLIGVLGVICKWFMRSPFGSNEKKLICTELIILLTNCLRLTSIVDSDSYGLNDLEKLLKSEGLI